MNHGLDLRQLLERDERLFSAHPQVARYFPSVAMENARKRILRSIDRGDSAALVVGAAGTGKSLLLQALASEYHARFDVVLLACANICTRRAMLQTILFELGLPYQLRDEGRLRLSLLDHLLSTEDSPAGLLMLVDEAQALSVALLDELRIMTNLIRGGVPRVRVVLAGSSALEENFAHPELESFTQRLAARCYLSAFSRDETAQFVRAQLTAAGAAPERVLAPGACDAIFDATDGVPRLVNQLCDRALLLAGEEGQPIVDRQLIQAAWADLQQLPVTWDVPRATAVDATSSVEFGCLESLPKADDEPAAADSDELELDLEPIGGATEIFPWQPTESPKPATPANNAHRSPRPPRDPANPFAEDFDEEEVVLNSFASWDEIVRPCTPRVENCRNDSLAALVDVALAALPAPSPDASAPVDGEFVEVPLDVDEADFCEADAAEVAAGPVVQATSWPRLCIAEISESAKAEAGAAEIAQAGHVVASSANGARFASEDPILILNDEHVASHSSGPAVRRLAYQHLFSRLRSG